MINVLTKVVVIKTEDKLTKLTVTTLIELVESKLTKLTKFQTRLVVIRC